MRNLILNGLLILIANSALSESIIIRNVDIYESSGIRKNVSIYVVDGIIKNIDSLIFQTADIEIDATNDDKDENLKSTNVISHETMKINPK